MLKCISIAPVSCHLHPTRYTAGRTGYTGVPAPRAIVIHLLQGVAPEGYTSELATPLPRFQTGSTNPKGVHFLITETGIMQFQEITNTVNGLDYILGPTWDGLNGLKPITDINGPFVHIGIFTEEQLTTNLLTLLCCIVTELGSNIPIISASDIQYDRPHLSINPSVSAQVYLCAENGGIVPPPNPSELQDQIDELKACCLSNTSRIIELEQQVTNLNLRVLELEDFRTYAEERIAWLEEQVSIIPTLITQLQILSDQVNDILERCCPKKEQAACFQYQLQPGQEMLVTPNQAIWLNLPTRVKDTVPPIVFPGPLWRARLLNCTWSLKAIVRFRLSKWCTGKKVSLYLVACGVKYLMAEHVVTSDSKQIITLEGNFILPGGCEDVHLLVATNDDNTTSAKVIDFADFSGCCVS